MSETINDVVILSGELPDCKYTSGANPVPRSTQPLTRANVEYVLGRLGLGVRLNMMDQSLAWTYGGATARHDYYRVVSDWLKRVDITAQGELPEVLQEIGAASPFHPMDEWLSGLVWDGHDYIGDLVATVETDNPLWEVYLENWLVQVVEGVRGWRVRHQPESLPYVLVLVGGQGLGKSHWLSALGGDYFKGEAELHLSSAAGKDHQVEALKWPMVELAELDGIFRKSDIAHMKSFISREVDSIRLPYARRAVSTPRMTSFCGSVNECEFLNDPSGSRRFWPVAVKSIRWDFDMDWAGLWAQAADLWAQDARFGLTAEQDALRVELAAQHTSVSTLEEHVGTYLDTHEGAPGVERRLMNRSELLTLLYGRSARFSPKEAADVGRVIEARYGPWRKIGGRQRVWDLPYNEFAMDPNTWPKVRHLAGV